MTDTDRRDAEAELRTVAVLPAAAGEFRSVLFDGDDRDLDGVQEPAFFGDLNLDQVVDAIVSGRDEYDLKPFFYAPLRDVPTVEYRHEVFRDLEEQEVAAAVGAFADEMRRARNFLALAKKQRFKYEKERWFLDAAEVYCKEVSA